MQLNSLEVTVTRNPIPSQQDADPSPALLAFLPWKSPASSRRFDQPVRSVPCGWHCLSCGRPSAGQPDGRRCLAVLALWRLQEGNAFLPPPPRVTRSGRQAATHASCESCCSLSSMRSSLSQCSSLASYNFASIDGYALATSHRDEGPTTPTSRSIRPNTPARLGVPSHLLQRSKRSDAFWAAVRRKNRHPAPVAATTQPSQAPAGQATAPRAVASTPLQRQRPTNPARIAPNGFQMGFPLVHKSSLPLSNFQTTRNFVRQQ